MHSWSILCVLLVIGVIALADADGKNLRRKRGSVRTPKGKVVEERRKRQTPTDCAFDCASECTKMVHGDVGYIDKGGLLDCLKECDKKCGLV